MGSMLHGWGVSVNYPNLDGTIEAAQLGLAPGGLSGVFGIRVEPQNRVEATAEMSQAIAPATCSTDL